jgi:hypothetical protein
VAVQRADADTSPCRNLFERNFGTELGQRSRGRLDDPVAIAHRVGAHRPMSLRRDGRH